MENINRIRASHGKRRLNWDKQLGYVARLHARRMAERTAVWHDKELARRVTRWRRVGQNTGRGDDCSQLLRAFWRSPGHRENILGRWRFVGAGTEWRNGRLYVQQVFESRRDPSNIYSYP